MEPVITLDECERCGRCCSHLRIGDEAAGLSLFPDEVHLFPEELVRPHLGKGVSEPTSIFTYQHTENVCVNLRDNMCQVYESRPLMCRSFPVRIGANGLTFAPGCKAVLNLIRGSKTIDSKSPEVDAAMEMTERLLVFHRSLVDGEVKWRYNLAKEQWEPMKP